MFVVARHGSEKNFLAKQTLQLNFPLTSHLHHPLTRKTLREKTATAGGRKKWFCIYYPIMIILRYNDSIPPGHSMKKR